MQHTLIGTSRGIALRRFAASDIDVYREWLQPHQEWHLWDGPYFGTPTPEEIDAACARLRTGLADGTIATESPARRAVIVEAAAPERMLGTVSWHWESEESDWRRMGLTVYEPALRGRGLGTEAMRLWTDHLFASTDVVRLDFSTWSGNSRMLAVGRRLGFTEEARFRQAREVRGERYDSVVMGVLRSEWDAARDVAPPR
ncbi:GNAT family protein [Microbacterium sp. CFBP9034]|uniref:GNAT family N-acetyltransferase n=1 Tax=Microbacterium sp. CFBP9034 TaxID=3096540 RepID=UPI002A6A8D41|nr:GNAT family protein [Microbacterium sp. CFBP9034]MDY0909067.1 GNAT family protein [Microbacterium sp. CFBP9034]